jgi:hypothetical protein
MWSRLRVLAPGVEVTVTRKGSAPIKRYFVAADGSRLTVLNLNDAVISTSAKHGLLKWAVEHPEQFTAPAGAFVNRNLRLSVDGVLEADRKIADRSQIVEALERPDIAEIVRPLSSHGSTGMAVAGVAAGFGPGFLLALSAADCRSGCEVQKGALFWAPVAGGILGYYAHRHKEGGVVYRAAAVGGPARQP